MPNPFCVTCAKEMTLTKVGILVIKIMPNGRHKDIYEGTKFTCGNCGCEVISEYFWRPRLCNWQEDFHTKEHELLKDREYVLEGKPPILRQLEDL